MSSSPARSPSTMTPLFGTDPSSAATSTRSPSGSATTSRSAASSTLPGPPPQPISGANHHAVFSFDLAPTQKLSIRIGSEQPLEHTLGTWCVRVVEQRRHNSMKCTGMVNPSAGQYRNLEDPRVSYMF